MKKPLILASGSLGRRELLQFHGYEFTVMPSNIPEPTEARLGSCEHYVAELAWLKAQAIAPQVENGIIIAADTVGWQHGQVVGKPDDAEHARRILRSLAGTTHELWTGVCLWVQPEGWQVCWQELSRVEMKPMSESEIDEYILTRKWEGCSGAYAIRMPDDPLLTVVEGSASNVIGLPMESLARALNWVETPSGAA